MTVHEDLLPDRLGQYLVEARLGSGGMGVVYLASGPDGLPVAVKALRQDCQPDPTDARRLAREVETMRRVASPHVAEVIDADLGADPPYIVTRYVPGQTLEDVVAERGPLEGEALSRLVRGLADALVAVHAAGVVHRDLKPGNVMLVDGEPVVIDFGIAQTPDSTRLTQTGMFMGTPGYLAPEVIEGRPHGPAADVHSWAATIAFAATGRPPFGTGGFEEIFYRILNGQPDLQHLPTGLVPLVVPALARDPSRRPVAADLAERSRRLSRRALIDKDETVAACSDRRSGADPAQGADGADARSALVRPASANAGLVPTVLDGHPGVRSGSTNGQTADPVRVPMNSTRPLPVRTGRDFADLLPPVRYEDQPTDVAAPRETQAADRRRSDAPNQRLAEAQRAQTRHVRPMLVGVVMVLLAAAAVMLPVVGAAAAIAVLILLRAGDLTAGWMDNWTARRRTGTTTTAAAGAAVFPVAVGRAVLRFLALAPVALLAGAVVATVTIVLIPHHPLPRAGAFAAGAVVLAYGLGPGSSYSRRSIGRVFGGVAASPAGAAIALLGMGALTAALVVAVAMLPPAYWPVTHLSADLQRMPTLHGFVHAFRLGLLRTARQLGL